MNTSTSSTTHQSTDVAVNQSLFRLFNLLFEASIAEHRYEQVDSDKQPEEYERLRRQVDELVYQAEQYLQQELGPYASHIQISWSPVLGSYGPHPLLH